MLGSIFARSRDWAANSRAIEGLRERRYRLFMELCEVDGKDVILDVGAGAGGALARFNTTNQIVAVDLAPDTSAWLSQPNVRVQVADARMLPFGDHEFPVAFSSSVVQYLTGDDRLAYANEIRRVAERYFVQTPNRYFPVDPHYQVPLFQFLPRGLRRAINRRVSLGWRERGDWQETELLGPAELRRLFPDAELHRERVFGLTKSLMAVRRPARSSTARAD